MDPEQDHGEQGLAPRVAALEKRLTPVSPEGTAICITGANRPMVHGLGQTDCGPEEHLIPNGPNGLGSLIVGAHDPRVGEGETIRTGAHKPDAWLAPRGGGSSCAGESVRRA
jgi:hypothetical protein